MNKKKLFTGLACAALVAVGCVALAGCGEQKNDWKDATDANFASLIQKKTAKIKLTEDVELEERIQFGAFECEINLNNHTLSISDAESNGILKTNSTALTIRNGKIKSTSNKLTLNVSGKSLVMLRAVELTNTNGSGIGVFEGSAVYLNNTKVDVKTQAIATNNTIGGKGQNVVIENNSDVSSQDTTVYLAANTNLNVVNSKITGKTPIHALLGNINVINSTLKTTDAAGSEKLSLEGVKNTNGPADLTDGSAILIRANWYVDRIAHEAGAKDMDLKLENVTFDNGDKVDVSVYNLKDVAGNPRAASDYDQYTNVKEYLQSLSETVSAKFYTVNTDVQEDAQ